MYYPCVLLLLTLLLSLNFTAAYAQVGADTVVIETSGNYITIPVTLNGKPMRFILDTGCGANMVFRHAIDSLEQVTANGDSIVSSTGRTEEAGVMQGCLRVSRFDDDSQVPIYVTTVDSVMRLRGDGIVGMQYILGRNRMNMKIDVRNRQAIFTPDKHLFDDDEGLKMRTRLSDNRVTIKLKVSPGFKVKNVVVDTGCDHLFDLDAADFSKMMEGRRAGRFLHQVLGKRPSGMEGMYGRNAGVVTSLRLDQLTVAGLRFHDVDTETGSESLLGFPFLQAASVVFYHKGKRIKVEPYTVVGDYRVVREKERVKRGQFTVTYNKEKVVEAWAR